MIVVFGALANPSVAFVCARLDERGTQVCLLHPCDYGSNFSVESQPHALRTASTVILAEEIQAVYVHFPEIPHSSGARGTPVGDATLATWLDDLPTKVVDRPRAMNSNASKPWQLVTIASHGFHVPASRATNNPEDARTFIHSHGGRVIYKTVSDRRAVVQSVTEGDLDRLDFLRACPVLFQENVTGTDIRIHRIGPDLVGTEILFDGIDYRYPNSAEAKAIMKPYEIPSDLADRCMALAEDLGLEFCGIDLRRQENGQWTCFEVNPAPGFVYYDRNSNQQIGDLLVNRLASSL